MIFEVSFYISDIIDLSNKSNILQKLSASSKFINVSYRYFLCAVKSFIRKQNKQNVIAIFVYLDTENIKWSQIFFFFFPDYKLRLSFIAASCVRAFKKWSRKNCKKVNKKKKKRGDISRNFFQMPGTSHFQSN